MPHDPTQPGVYISEVPEGIPPISGAPTSIAAFIGRAARGPINEPITLHSFKDFERTFGGLGMDFPMSYAVRDFFANGGAQAIAVRIYSATTGNASAQINANGLALEAANPGTWGNELRVRVNHAASPEPSWLISAGLRKADFFNLVIHDSATGATETILNLTVAESPRRVDRVLEEESALVRIAGLPPATIPSAHPDPAVGDDPWGDNRLSSPVSAEGNDSDPLDEAAYTGTRDGQSGLYALEKASLFNLLCIPPDTRGGTIPRAVYATALSYCVERRAMLIVDPPAEWSSAADALDRLNGDIGLNGAEARNAVLYFPRIRQEDPLMDGNLDIFVPCGAVAGVIARTDAERGVWKSPAGLDAVLNGIEELAVAMTDSENGLLNQHGINSLRSVPAVGQVVWGARTLRGADQLRDEYRYLPVRRLALFVEESLDRGTRWAASERNEEALWSKLRLSVSTFMRDLFRMGAFQGRTERDAYFVKVDETTTSPKDVESGFVNLIVGFAPLKPAEFVVIGMQQQARQNRLISQNDLVSRSLRAQSFPIRMKRPDR